MTKAHDDWMPGMTVLVVANLCALIAACIGLHWALSMLTARWWVHVIASPVLLWSACICVERWLSVVTFTVIGWCFRWRNRIGGGRG